MPLTSSIADYFLTTPRLGFRRWRGDDSILAYRLWGDRRATALIGGPFSTEQIDARLQNEIATQAKSGFQYWPIFVLDTHQHAGCAGLRPYLQDPNVVEFGIHLLPEYWGQGLAEEAGRAVIAYAFSNTNARSLFAGHHPDNHGSRRLLAKLGFRFTHLELYAPTGQEHCSYLLDHGHCGGDLAEKG
jgi:[ribosomal protein S5]-alanine N-acetyltransferase